MMDEGCYHTSKVVSTEGAWLLRVADGVRGVRWKERAYLRKEYPGILPLSNAQLTILEKLAKTAPTNPLKLSKMTKKAYSFVQNTLTDLERRKAVSAYWGKNEKGTPTRIYGLELEGILWILDKKLGWIMEKPTRDIASFDLITGMFKHYSSKLPLVFSKWSYFRDNGLEELFFIRLQILASTHMKTPFYRGTGYYYWLDMESSS